MHLSEDDIKRRGLIYAGFHMPYNPNLIDRAKELRKHMTAAEEKLWSGFLKQFRYRIRPQHPIDNYIVDFYCSSLKLIIEIDGEQHYTGEGKIYDNERDAVLELYGLKVVRFTNKEVTKNFDVVCKQIDDFAHLNSPLEGGMSEGQGGNAAEHEKRK